MGVFSEIHMSRLSKQIGFTLVELLVTIAILGILAALGLANAKKFRDAGLRAVSVEFVASVKTATYGFLSLAPDRCSQVLQLRYYLNPPPGSAGPAGDGNLFDVHCNYGGGPDAELTAAWQNFLGESLTTLPANGPRSQLQAWGGGILYSDSRREDVIVLAGSCTLQDSQFYMYYDPAEPGAAVRQGWQNWGPETCAEPSY